MSMNTNDTTACEYRAFIKAVNREPPPGDDFPSLAAQDALTAAYGLEGYLEPTERKRRTKAVTASQAGQPVSRERDEGGSPCRA
jgi:hypothetical protein